MDAILKALADKTRRDLLDALRARDGQTLSELEASLTMSRFGVMKHLKLLEEAGLVLTHRAGRFKYHYLNAAPLQEVVDRWIEPLTRGPATRALLDLKSQLEGPEQMTLNADKPDFVLETYIKASPERIWEALTSAELSRLYYIAGAAIHSDFGDGSNYQYVTDDGTVMLHGQIISADPPKRLEMTFHPGWLGPDAKPSRNVYLIEAEANSSKLTVLHFDIPPGNEGVKQGWVKIVASLKTLLETGEPLPLG